VQFILRILGLNLLAHVGTRLPNSVARTLSSLALIAANLLPIKAVMDGSLGMGDVFVLYWLENVMVYVLTIIKLLTVENADVGKAGFFALHYGIFTFVHGIFAFILAGFTGWFHGGLLYWAVVLAALLASHLVSLGLNWFGRGEYRVASPGRVMAMPYPRMFVMHGAVILGANLVFGPHTVRHELLAVAALCGAKAVIDLVFHLIERVVNSGILNRKAMT
jgi:hypothetical protein